MRRFSSKLASQQAGFTLIELVIVIVIIGILAAVAIPQFANLSDDAGKGAANGIAGAIASASASNSARCKGGLCGAKAATDCASQSTLLEGGVLPTGFTMTTGGTAASATANGSCGVTHTASTKASVAVPTFYCAAATTAC